MSRLPIRPFETGGDPFGLASHKGPAPSNQAALRSLPDNGIPDAAALDPPSGNGADQSRYTQVVGPSLDSPSVAGPIFRRGESENNAANAQSKQNPANPPLVEQYRSGGGEANRSLAGYRSGDRYSDEGDPPDRQQGYAKNADRYGDNRGATAALASNGQEPAPFMADPTSAPKALTQTADRGRERYTGANAGLSAAEGIANGEGTGQPGSKQLEGAQTPQVTIQKFAPREIQVGKPAAFKIAVRNTGPIPAAQVEIRDQVPRGTKLLGTTPRASLGPHGEILWTIGTLRPGEESPWKCK